MRVLTSIFRDSDCISVGVAAATRLSLRLLKRDLTAVSKSSTLGDLDESLMDSTLPS